MNDNQNVAPIQPGEAMSAREVAAALGIPQPTVYRLARRGVLRRVKIGGKVLISRQSVERHLRALRDERPLPR